MSKADTTRKEAQEAEERAKMEEHQKKVAAEKKQMADEMKKKQEEMEDKMRELGRWWEKRDFEGWGDVGWEFMEVFEFCECDVGKLSYEFWRFDIDFSF